MREMKDSGIDIIGNIPTEWNLIRLKYLCNIQTGDSDTQEADPDGEYSFYVRSPIIEKSNSYTFDGEGILMAGDGAGAGRIFHHAYGKYAVHQRVYRLSNFKNINSNILFYYLQNLFCKQMDKGSAQSTVPSVRLPMLLNFNICIPPECEQERIADYLDSKCTEIDNLSEEIQSEISFLEQYKKSVITEAVTKGLNPNVEMKDSGIQWIGKIPSHWRSEKVKYHLRRNEPKNPGNVEVLSVYREYGVIPKNSRDDNHNVTSEDTSKYKYVRKNVLVINKMKAWQGSMGVSDYEGIVSPAYFLYDIVSNTVYPQYLHFLFRTVYKDEFKRISGGIREGQWDLSPYEFENELFLIPPISEQKEIVNAITIKSTEIDATINEKKEQLATLSEYKKSLIYEYVTGKKEIPTENTSTVVALEPRMMLLGTIIDKLGSNQKGRIQLQKILYLADMHLGLNRDIQYYRYDHGPYDIHLNDYIDKMVKNGWYQHRNQGSALLVAGKNHADFLRSAKNMFGDKETEIGNLLNLLQSMNVLKRTRMERIATLYAAWNDFLLEGITPIDDQIIQEVMTNWTENKGNTKYETWQDSLNKMKTNGLIPKGVGLHTLPKPQKEVADNE